MARMAAHSPDLQITSQNLAQNYNNLPGEGELKRPPALLQQQLLTLRQQAQSIQQLKILSMQGRATPFHLQNLNTLLYAHAALRSKLLLHQQSQQPSSSSPPNTPLQNNRSIQRPLFPMPNGVPQRPGVPATMPENTYAPRLKRGGTSLIIPVPLVVLERPRRSRYFPYL
jgi:hypothetical protein